MATEETRAQDLCVSLPKLRRHTALRIDRIRHAAFAMQLRWEELDDSEIGLAFADFDDALEKLRGALADIDSYYDLPIGQEVAP